MTSSILKSSETRSDAITLTPSSPSSADSSSASMPDNAHDENDPASSAVAGALAGCVSLILCYPLGTISTRRQAKSTAEEAASSLKTPVTDFANDSTKQERTDKVNLCFRSEKRQTRVVKNSLIPGNERRRSILHKIVLLLRRYAFMTTVRERLILLLHEVKSLYAGISSALYGQVVIQFSYYYAYIFVRRLFGEHYGKSLTTLQDVFSAAIAGLSSATITNPFWVVNTRKILAPNRRSNIKLVFDILRNEGLGALLKGIFPSYVLVTNPIISYSIYEALKKFILHYMGGQSSAPRRLSSRQIFLCSALGKLVATVVTYPYIMCRTYLQTENASKMPITRGLAKQEPLGNAGLSGPYSEALKMMEYLRNVLSTEGFCGLYRGLKSKVLQSVLSTALLFVVQERLVRCFARVLCVLQDKV